MDFKSLLTKLDTIDKGQILTESEDRKPAKKSEREVELPSGAKVKATKVQGWQSQKGDKEADKERKKNDESISFKSSIAQALLKEFNYQDDELEEENLEEADFQFSPEQEKWLGGANRQDPYIIARMPGPKPPLTYFKDPEDQAIAKQMNIGQGNLNSLKKVVGMQPGDAQTFADPSANQAASPTKAPAAPTATAQTDDDGNTLVTTASGATSALGPDGKPLPNGGRITPAPSAQAGAPGAQDDATGVDAAVAANAADDAKRAAAGGQAASPANPAGKKPPAVSPAIIGYASSMGLYKNGQPDVAAIKKFQQDNGLTADGIIGPNTAGAILSAQKPGMAGSGRGGQGGPTAAQAATSKVAAAPSAKPAAPSAKPAASPSTWDKIKNWATGGSNQAASPAAAPAEQPKITPRRKAAGESVTFAEEDIVARIKHLSGL